MPRSARPCRSVDVGGDKLSLMTEAAPTSEPPRYAYLFITLDGKVCGALRTYRKLLTSGPAQGMPAMRAMVSRRYRARATTTGPWQCVDYAVGSSPENIELEWDTMFPDLPDDRMEDPTAGESLELSVDGATREYVLASVPAEQIPEAEAWFVRSDMDSD